MGVKEVAKVEKLAAVTEQDTDSEMTTSTETDNTTGNDDNIISGNGVRDMMMMLKLTCPALSPLRCSHRQISNIRSWFKLFEYSQILHHQKIMEMEHLTFAESFILYNFRSQQPPVTIP